jgi:DNA-binding NtrC family response regulator
MSDGPDRMLLLVGADAVQARQISSLAAREGWETLLLHDASASPPLGAGPRGASRRAIWFDPGQRRESIAGAVHAVRARTGDAAVVVLCESRDQAIAALRDGADDFLLKPLASERIVAALRAVDPAAEPGLGPSTLIEKDEEGTDLETMVGTAPGFRDALAAAARAASRTGPILVSGETGTGKDRLIRAIHGVSARSKRPLRFVNAGLVPASAIESRLFGHEKNAFAGAFDRNVGAIQQCGGGTVVIDEIERLAPALQHRMLEFIREGAVRPIGATYGQRVDVRLIAAANVNLGALAEAGRFLPELLEALAPITITLPPLRERAGDIPALTRHFLSGFASIPGIGEVEVTDAALALLSRYDWPGNVRQLHSALLRAAVLSGGAELTPAAFPALQSCWLHRPREVLAAAKLPGRVAVPLYTSDGNLRPLEQIEGDVIRLAIGHYRGRMTEVARRLGIGRSTLYRKLGELGIDNAA